MVAKALDTAAFFCVTTDLYGNNLEVVHKWLKDRQVEPVPAAQFLISALFAIATYLSSFFDFAWYGFSIDQARGHQDWF